MTTTTQIPDLRPLLLDALGVVDDLVATVEPTDLDRPTPCTDFAVRGLLDHLVMVVRRVRVVLTGGHFADVPQVTGLPDDELAGAFSDGLAVLRTTLPDVDLTALATAPFGTVPNAAALASYVGEVLVHGWDLARALDRTDLLRGALAEPVVEPASRRLPREGREGLPFGEVVDAPADADALERLVAWMGRDPRWRP